jgi:filamentous hemagglutinin family protein
VYEIDEHQGRLVGQNLFHSFDFFSVPAADAAVFTTSSTSIVNVVARVTGMSPSVIEGLVLLQPAAGSNPNLFFINPAGIAFAAGARVDVPAALHFSTASGLHLSDGHAFNAARSADALSDAQPDRFEFRGGEADVVFRASSQQTDIALRSSALDLSGRNIEIRDANVSAGLSNVTDGTQVRLLAVGRDKGAVPLAFATEDPAHGELILRGGLFKIGGLASDISFSSQRVDTSYPYETHIGELKASEILVAPATDSGRNGVIAVRGADILLDGVTVTVGSSFIGHGLDVSMVADSSIVLRNGAAIGGNLGALEASTLRFKAPSIDIADTRIALDGVQAGTFSDRFSANLQIDASALNIERTRISGSDSGRNVDISASSARLAETTIDAGISGNGVSSGSVSIVADTLMLDGVNISSTTSHSTRNGGEITINAPHLLLINSSISTDTSSRADSFTHKGGSANSGNINISGDLVTLDSSGLSTSSQAESGAAGDIAISARVLDFKRGGRIVAEAFSSGRTGNISISAQHVAFEGWTVSSGNQSNVAEPHNLGQATVAIVSPEITLKDTSISTETLGNVNAGRILIMPSASGTGDLSVTADAVSNITSSTRQHIATSGNAGTIEVRGTNINLSGVTLTSEALPGSTGNAGSIAVDASGNVQLLAGTRMSTNTFDVGNAGTITMKAGSLTMDESQISTITDGRPFRLFAYGTYWDIPARTATGNAGNIQFDVNRALSILNNSRIATDTAGSGSAGDVTVKAGTLLVDPSEISSRAIAGSSGQTGNIGVTANNSVTIADGSRLSIQNDALSGSQTINPTSITVSAPRIELRGGEISAAASRDLPASNVQIAASDLLLMRDASITTTAQDGNGGSIHVNGGRALLLDHSQITTSVFGTQSGNGGDIGVSAQTLVLDTGFIQANTRAPLATGGGVLIDVGGVVARGALLLGGDKAIQFDAALNGINVIQAAAPGGVAGEVNVTAPVLDIAGNLKGLPAQAALSGALNRDLCGLSAGSSLTPIGRGGLRPTASGLIRPDNIVVTARDDKREAESTSRTSMPQTKEVTAYRCDK